jgi:hypothetical protein
MPCKEFYIPAFLQTFMPCKEFYIPVMLGKLYTFVLANRWIIHHRIFGISTKTLPVERSSNQNLHALCRNIVSLDSECVIEEPGHHNQFNRRTMDSESKLNIDANFLRKINMTMLDK